MPAIITLIHMTAKPGYPAGDDSIHHFPFLRADFPYLIQMLAIIPSTAAAYVAGDASTKAAIAIPSGVDPQFLFRYGVIGLWILVVSILGLLGGKLPKILSYLGIATAILYWLLAATDVLGSETIIRSIIAMLGAVIVGPIWYIWIGVRLRKVTS